MRILLATLIVLAAALGFLSLERERRAHCYGWTAPEMDEHWARLEIERSFHAAKNVMSEWVRLDPQRAGKLFSFALVCSLILNAALLIKE